MSGYIIPLLICAVFIHAAIKRTDAFSSFIEGAKDGLQTTVKMLPPLVILITAISMLRASGVLDLVSSLLAPLFSAAGIPVEVTPLALLRPISGSGAMAILSDIIAQNGPDSFAGRVAAVMTGSTETTFYTLAVYFGSTHATNTRYALAASLFADAVSFIMSVLTVRLIFGT